MFHIVGIYRQVDYELYGLPFVGRFRHRFEFNLVVAACYYGKRMGQTYFRITLCHTDSHFTEVES